MPTTLLGDNVSLSMVKPIFILSGETTIEANLVWLLKDVLFSQNDFLSAVVVMLYWSHNWLSVLNQLKIVSLSTANKTLPSTAILFLSAKRVGVPETGVVDGCVFWGVLEVGVFVTTEAGSCFWKNKKYPAIPPSMTTTKTITSIFENPFWFMVFNEKISFALPKYGSGRFVFRFFGSLESSLRNLFCPPAHSEPRCARRGRAFLLAKFQLAERVGFEPTDRFYTITG